MVEYDDDATPLDYDELKGLLPTHITTRSELDFLEMENISQAIIWSESLKATDILNIGFICKLHKKNVFQCMEMGRKIQEIPKKYRYPIHSDRSGTANTV